VLRDGEETELPAATWCPATSSCCAAGDRVPADARLLEAINLQVQEAALTGESMAVDKQVAPLAAADLPLGDRRNMVYAGTAIAYGRGRALVGATGMATEFGRVAQMLQTVETGKTPLQVNLDKLGGQLARAAIAVVAIIVGLGLARGPAVHRDAGVRHRARGGGGARSAARGGHDLARARRAAAGQARRVDAPAAGGGDAGQHLGDLLGQDRHADARRDDRAPCGAAAPRSHRRQGYEPHGEFTHEGAGRYARPGAARPADAAALCTDARIVHDEGGHWIVKGDPTEGALVVAAAKAGLHKLAWKRRSRASTRSPSPEPSA
jgi:P-type Ca2+ transporter type 2C